MINKKIAIIGVGHIGQAVTAGLLRGKAVSGKNLLLISPHLDKLSKFKKEYGVRITKNNREAAEFADILLIAVRPRIVRRVIEEIRDDIRKETLIISMAACVTLELLTNYFRKDSLKIIRIMPNLPVVYGLGVVGWIGNKRIKENDKKLFERLLGPLGLLVACRDEASLDRLSMISGCGPGIVGYFMDNLERAAKDSGFSPKLAERIIRATFHGTIHHLKATKISPQELVSSVATKGGITEKVLRNLDKRGFYHNLSKSIKKGYDKIGKITKELENGYLR